MATDRERKGQLKSVVSERRRPSATELALEMAALREELAAIQRLGQALADFGARARIEERISRLRDEFEDRLLEYAQALERSNHELTTSYRLLKLVTDSIPDPVYVKDRHSRFLMCNVALGETLGVSAQDLIGTTGAAYLPQETVDQMLADDRRIMDDGTLHRYEETVLLAPGDSRRYLTTKIPFHDAAGDIVGLIGVSRDITAARDPQIR